MDAAALHSRTLMSTFQPQSVANMIWAYATLAHKPATEFLDLLCGHALQELPNFSPQNISNTVWALATLKHNNRVCIQPVCCSSPLHHDRGSVLQVSKLCVCLKPWLQLSLQLQIERAPGSEGGIAVNGPTAEREAWLSTVLLLKGRHRCQWSLC